MSFDSKKTEFGKEHINIVEVDLDLCDLTYNVGACLGGFRKIITTAVGTDDFAVGDTIQGSDATPAVAIITEITGSSPTYTFQYRLTNGINFTTAAETITNTTTDKTGVATKSSGAPTFDTAANAGLECFNTLETCQDLTNYTDEITTGAIDIDVDATAKTFTKLTGTSFIVLGFTVGSKITSSVFTDDGNNSTFIIASVTATIITVEDAQNMVTESGTGDEILIQKTIKTHSWCESRSPYPTDMLVGANDPDTIPSIKSFKITPSKIDLKGGLGVRAKSTVVFKDHPTSDIGVDDHLATRLQEALESGTYWTKWRSRNTNYQNRPMRTLSGYLNNGAFDIVNFETRSFLVDSLSISNGVTRMEGIDPLRLVSSKKAQAPAVSTASLSANLGIGVTTTFTVTPTGAGDENFGSSGHVLIGKEVIKYNSRSGDVLTIGASNRGTYNTSDAAHKIDDTVQECLIYTAKTVDLIVYDLLVNYANVDPTFIDVAAWATEITEYLSGNLTGIIVKPMDVNKILKELAENKAHYLWWDEVSSKIQLTALREPPADATVLNMDEHLVAGSVSIKDNPEMRITTVLVNFGQVDPTLKLDEVGNYEQTYARHDIESFRKYGSDSIRVINSRWLTNTSKVGAIQVATLIGRRFANVPRSISFQLDAKDGGRTGVWIGQSQSINYREIVDFYGSPIDTVFQLLSVREQGNYYYEGLEYNYGGALTDDEASEASGFKTVRISTDIANINLYDLWFTDYGVPTGTDKAKFIIEANVKVYSTSISTVAMETGTWAAVQSIDIILESGAYVVGKGGNGEVSVAGEDGGDAISLGHDVNINNSGTIGGGGGGGGGGFTGSSDAGGGGGAGKDIGFGGGAQGDIEEDSEDGTLTIGGAGAYAETSGVGVNGGDGGNLGQAGDSGDDTAGGAGGYAVDENTSYTATITGTGLVKGTIGTH